MSHHAETETKSCRRLRAPTDRNGAVAVGLFALLFSIYLFTFSGIYHASDEMSMLTVADSLARRGGWDIEPLRWMGEQQGSFGPDGHLYGRKGIGMTLAVLPHYWLALQSARLGNVQMAMLTSAVVVALTAVLIYLFLRRLGYPQGGALGTALAFGLATMAWPYARYLFSESLAGLGLMLSAYALVCYGTPRPAIPRGQGEDSGSSLRADAPWCAEGDAPGRGLYPLFAGVGLGIALLARLNNAIVAPFLGLLLLFYLHRIYGANWRRWIGPIVLFGLPVLAALGITGWYNWLRFGNLLTTGYLPEERFATPFLEGLYGLILSPGKGMLWYNPILFAALAAWPAFYRRHRAEALLAGVVVLSNIAFYAPWYLWWAGHGWGPRFLVTILPFAILPLAGALEIPFRTPRPNRAMGARTHSARRRWAAIGLGLLAAISLAVQIPAVAIDFNLYLEDVYAELGLYHPATLFDPAYSPLLRQWAYLRPGNLDLAWAREGSVDWIALLIGSGLVLVSGLALWAAWQGRFRVWARAGLLVLLGLGASLSLMRYAPGGDVAVTAQNLIAMEQSGELAVVTDPLLTEPFQDAYDGSLWVWGVPQKEQVGVESNSVWVIGPGDPAPAAARFQTGGTRLDAYLPSGQRFDLTRLPVALLPEEANLGNSVALVAINADTATIRQGQALPLTLYWRALAPMDVSYTVLVQAIDQAGVKAGQIDLLPCSGDCPTTTWQPGDVVGQSYKIPILADAPPGRYQLITGMYDLATGERLPLLDAQGHALADQILLGWIDVQP